MKIAIDAMGGDHAPHEIVKGTIDALNDVKATLVLVGDEEAIKNELSKYTYDSSRIEIHATTEVVENCDKPVSAIRTKADSSMVVGLKQVRQKEFDGFISAGNTGALLAGGAMKVGRIKGIERPALGTALPTMKGFTVLLDSGANAECKARNLKEFAIMGSLYSQLILGVENPKVSLVNVGEEETKGTPVVQEAYQLLKEEKSINFAGNIEGREIFAGVTDVIVCDGFTGNVILKLLEGMAKGFGDLLKGVFTASPKNMFAAALVKKDLDGFKKKLDYKEYGGAPLLGVNGNVVKAHGSSDAKAIKNAIKYATRFAEADLVQKISDAVKE